MSVAIIDYGSGNLRSAAKAFEHVCDDQVLVTSDPSAVRAASHIVLPGVGAFADCRKGLAAVAGMEETLHEVVIEGGRPFLGICVGMQLMASVGEEFGETAGLDWIRGRIKAIEPADPALKIPHMGWNELHGLHDHAVLDGIDHGAYAYFVHSFHFVPDSNDHLLATVDYGGNLTAAIGRDNMVGTQFHPEKSQATGLRLIENFIKWKP
ncbi:imidazole glycerol phosphate synthase subunit HisH [Aestuariispira insulae]|uniref:Imidazole glycerol phosphate synthase subunit HisH n=1 Tax=Aestuariispira insulae TaxID=1461337 RepID=A0A3D9HPG7_9PROT|nr:imidazole glycerol phosphate synthase subunit HisH [Aestuariispira insulae]RED51387.1 glutamine amidotransferase [Aestuariispira insulae]